MPSRMRPRIRLHENDRHLAGRKRPEHAHRSPQFVKQLSFYLLVMLTLLVSQSSRLESQDPTPPEDHLGHLPLPLRLHVRHLPRARHRRDYRRQRRHHHRRSV